MKLHIQVALLLIAVTVATSITTTVCLQSIAKRPLPVTKLAKIQYDPSLLRAEFASFDAPELSSEANIVRIGICDTDTYIWKASISVTSINSFNKGYAPIITLSLDTHGDVIGVACKSAKVDAGQTRDFGPKVKVVKMNKGKKPDLNQPIVVSKEGTVEGVLPEKTLLQKYWWVAAAVMVLLLATGGGDK